MTCTSAQTPVHKSASDTWSWGRVHTWICAIYVCRRFPATCTHKDLCHLYIEACLCLVHQLDSDMLRVVDYLEFVGCRSQFVYQTWCNNVRVTAGEYNFKIDYNVLDTSMLTIPSTYVVNMNTLGWATVKFSSKLHYKIIWLLWSQKHIFPIVKVYKFWGEWPKQCFG